MSLLTRATGLGAAIVAIMFAHRRVHRERQAAETDPYREYDDAARDPEYQAVLAEYEKLNREFDVAVGDGLENVPHIPR